ncbi:MAG: hypothetical protein LIO90_11495 [Bacteroidales bacterium]|nr:hypothetical protein [Bacteroidales bacterium]
MKAKVNRISDEEKRRYVDLYITGEYTIREAAAMDGFSHTSLPSFPVYPSLVKEIVPMRPNEV